MNSFNNSAFVQYKWFAITRVPLQQKWGEKELFKLKMQVCVVFFFFLSFPDLLFTVQPHSRQTSFIGKSVWLNVGANYFSHVSDLCKAMEKNEGHRQKCCLGSKKAGGHYVEDISMN